MDAVVISDLHLGSDVCQAKHLGHFLEDIHKEELKTNCLILNGDIFDNWDMRRLKKTHWHVLSTIRKLSDHVHVVWINGNHDGPADIISHLLGVEVVGEFVLESGDKHVLFQHGHQYDTFIDTHPILTHVADWIYWGLMKVDPSFGLAKAAKHSSKSFLRNSEIIQKDAVAEAKKRKCSAVCVGHTHSARLERAGDIVYANSGCWTELPCTFLTVMNGRVELHAYP